MKSIAQEIKQFRYSQGLTQEQLGKMLEPPVGKNSISDWERGRSTPSPTNYRKLKALMTQEDSDVEVLKRKKGYATKIKWQGLEYALIHPDQYRGRSV